MKDNKTRQEIIKTAYRLFKDNGYDKVTVNDICEACSITKTTFYYHLNSKVEIVNAYYRGVIADQADRLVEVLAAENHWEQLITCFEQLLDASSEIGPDIFGQIYIMNLKEDHRSFDLDENLTRMAVILIQRAQQAGEILNKSDPFELYRAACHSFEGFELMWCIKKGSFNRKKVVRRALEQIFDVAPGLRRTEEIAYDY